MTSEIMTFLRRTLPALVAILCASWALPSAGQTTKSIYSVSGVPIDATAASSTVAKSQALTAGRQVAFQRLVSRVTLPEDIQAKGGIPVIAPDVLERMIASYSVSDEKSSTVRYLARLTVEFDATAVKSWLTSFGATPINSRALPLAVFPFAPNAPEPDRVALSTAWRSAGLESELVPLALSSVPAVENQFPAYEAAAKAAGAGGAVLASVQTTEANGTLTAMTKVTKLENGARFELGSAQASVPAPSAAARSTAIQTLMDKSVIAASNLVQLEWKRRAVVRGGQVASVAVTAEYSSLEEWNAIRNALGRSTIIRDIRIEAISKDGALLTIAYTGSEAQLQTDVAQSRLTLQSEDKGLILRSQR